MFLALHSSVSLSEAVGNAAMGMGTVFLMLIFIMFIISLFSVIPKIQAKFEKKETKPVETAAPASVPAPAGNLMDDAQLVAVITAAIYAANSNAGVACKDQLVVRSIRRAR